MYNFRRMYFTILLLICLAMPSRNSFLSRVKNRYEYIPQEDIINVTEELYDFDTTRQEKLVSYTMKRVETTELEPDDIVYIAQEQQTEKRAALEVNTTTTELDATEMDNVIYDYDVWPHTIPQWRPTVVNTEGKDVTWKRRKTFPTHFPTKITFSTEGTNATARKGILKSRVSRTSPWFSTMKRFTNISMSTLPSRRYMPVIASAKCYWCGMYESGIPRSANCYAVFNSPDQRWRRLRKDNEIACVATMWPKWPRPKTLYSMSFRGGCFKRFLDVGVIYTERGCRTHKGWKGSSYASNRFVHLERLLSGVQDGCIFSPAASLTPYSRAISLYARYHVCVCKKNYCNHASFTRFDSLYIHMMLLMNIFHLWFTNNV